MASRVVKRLSWLSQEGEGGLAGSWPRGVGWDPPPKKVTGAHGRATTKDQ